MFRTKHEVDRHTADLLRRVRDEKEKSSKGYQIAKLYHQIGEHEIAKRYLTAFLNVREAVPQAHKLMGQIFESLKDYKRAISSYERCLQLNENQKDVILKVCELLNQIEVAPGTIRYWVERAESMFPTNEIIFNLKEKIVGAESEGNPIEMANLFKSELAKKPGNVRIHIKLLQLYINSKKVDAAIEYAISVDSLRIFDFNIEWYDYLVEFYACPIVANSIEQQTSGPNVYIHKMFVHCKQILLWLQYKDVSDASQALHVFDQLLLTAATMDYRQPEWGAFLTEMKGYFFFFGGTLLFKRALKGQLTWKEAETLASICYLVSENHQPVDKQSEWYLRGDGSKRLFLSHLHKMGCYRLSQGGHVLSEIAKKHSSNWVNDLRTRYGTPTGKERLYDLLFTFREMRSVRDKSFLLSDCGFSNMAAPAVPTKAELAEYDASAHLLNPSDLNNIVWLSLHHFNSAKDESQPAYNFSLFDNLHYSSRNLSRGLHQGIESLCQLDMEVFLCCAVYCTSQQLQQVRPEPHQPHLLPRVLCRQFCTQEQADWWKLACKLGDKVETENFTKMRLILMRGLDTVRLVGSHGMSATLITHLARTLQTRAAKMKKDVDNGHGSFNKLEELEERAAFYWDAALPLLQRLQKNLVLKMPKERLFAEDSDNRLSSSQIKEMLSDAEYHLALCFMRRGEYEEAIKRFENLTNPWASYHAAQIYRKLALNEHNAKGREETTSDNHSHYTVLLTKAREALYVTLDRLKGNKSHQLNLVISQDIDDIECLLTRVDIDNASVPQCASYFTSCSRSVVDGDSSGESFCSVNSNGSTNQFVEESYINDSNTNRVSTPVESHNCTQDFQKEQKKSPLATKHHTPKNHHGSSEGSHIRPSPERLDAQLRALQLSHSSILKPIVDQNKELTKLNVALQRDMRDLREQHQEMSNQLREMQELNRLYWAELSQYRMMSGGFPQGPPPQQAPPPSQAGPPQAGPPPQNLAAAYMNSPYRPPSIQLAPQPPPWIASQYPAYQLPGTNPSASYRASSPKNLQNSRQSGMTPYSKMAAEDSHNAEENEVEDDEDDDEEEDPCHVDGEYYDGSNNQSPNNFHIPDSQLVQEWPFGHQTGLVGKSTVTYSVQNRAPMPRAGYFADVLRGQTLQYGYHTSQSPIGRMPGPGYFSGNKGQNLMFAPPSTQVPGTPPSQPPPLASALSGKSPVFQPSSSLSPLPPMPPNAVVGPTFAKPIASPAAAETPQSFFQKIRGQTPFQLAMPPSTLGAGPPADSFTPPQTNSPCSGFTTPIRPPQRSTYDTSFPQTWQGEKSVLSTPQVPAPQQVSGLPQSPVFQTVSFAAKGCFVNYEGKSHMAIVRVINLCDGKGVIVVALAADEKQVLLQQTITADLDIQITVFKNQQVSWCQPASCAKENSKLAPKCSVEFEKVGDATNFKMTVNAARIKLSPVPTASSPGTANKPENSFPSVTTTTTTITVSGAVGSVSGTPKASQSPVVQSPLAAALSSNQPATTSALLKVLNQTSDAKSTISSTPTSSTVVQETQKGTKTLDGFTLTSTPKVDFDLSTTKSNILMSKDSTDFVSETTSNSSAQKSPWNFSFQATTTATECVTSSSSPKPAVTNVIKNTNSNEKMGFMETKPSFNIFQSDMSLPVVKLFPSSCEGGKDDEVEEYEPNVDFKPVIPLPELVDLKTGEEEEEKMFGDRAKLYRFDKDISQWKERGVGELKLLRNKKNNRCRLLMRREQVLKLCANHFITQDMKLTPMPASDKAWCWVAQDFADEELRFEKFTARFKTAEVAEQFQEAFEKCRNLAPDIMESPGNSGKKAETTSSTEVATSGSSSLPPLSEMFKPKKGSWECDSCYIVNDVSALQCIACASLKPGVKQADVPSSVPSKTIINTDCITQTGFKFDASSSAATKDSGFTFTPEKFVISSTTASSTPVFNTDGSGFKFTPMLPSASTSSNSSNSFVFNNETVNVFGKTGATSTPSTTTTKSDPPKQNNNSIVPLNELFKPKSGSWNCNVCLLQCTATQQACPACNAPKPGVSTTSTFSSSKTSFSFPASTTNTTFVFGSTSSEPKSNSDKDTAKQKEKNIFGTPSALSRGSENKPPNVFNFTQSTSSMTPPTIQPATIYKPSPTLVSGSSTPTQPLFPFSLTTTTPNQTPKLEESKSSDAADDGYYVNKDGEDSHIYFEPVVPLPEKVEVKTGEEDEMCLFEHRAKLYRFAGHEWKERGIGNIKILENIQTKKLRIVMRREQVLKVCCNHYITVDLDLKPMQKSNGNAWVWYAMDFSDGGEPTHQQLSIRFKNADIANDFKKAFDNAKEKAAAYAAEASMSKSKSDDVGTRMPVSKPDESKVTVKSPLSRQLFTTSSEQEDDVIFVSKTEATPEQIKKARDFLLPDHFYLYETKTPCSGCRGCELEDLKNVAKTKSTPLAQPFESKTTEKTKPTEEIGQKIFGESTPTSDLFSSFLTDISNQTPTGLLFSTLAAQADSTEKTAFQKDSSKPFTWQGAGQKLFGASLDSTKDDDDVIPSQDIHFEPVIPLPELIERKSGEEDETPIFIERAKLFRFDQNEWKEKGIGSMKILKHNTDLRFRLLLRREQVLKLACNHTLTAALNLKPLDTSEKSWCWMAHDYTDSTTGQVELFAVKFKTIAIASRFQKCFLECQEILRKAEETESKTIQSDSNINELEKSIKQLNVEQNTSDADCVDEENEDEEDEEEEVEEEEEEEDDEEYEDEDDEYEPVFDAKATLSYMEDGKWKVAGKGNLLVVTGDDVSRMSIRMKADNSNLICNHMITRETQLKQGERNTAVWVAMDYAVDEPAPANNLKKLLKGAWSWP
ncbi:RANBP2 [Acanthosepion pharaonis]|uniref:RANBP2 n=1 Tax=Acanthosepion pharaonis TaxID=158019 RepID=A0A812DLB3_ACAPH|nr:RANBP2 [Sepia pharaonis]